MSSVDSANFITALIVAREYFSGDIKRAVDEYLKTVDFSALYDKSQNLFLYRLRQTKKHLFGALRQRGFGVKASFVSRRVFRYAARVVGKTFKEVCAKSRKLSAVVFRHDFLNTKCPTCFWTCRRAVFLTKTSKIAAKIIKKHEKNAEFFGISESGYFDLDAANNFRYYAFGVKEISVRGEETSFVFLALFDVSFAG
ncbi:MAG: hypothetical protein L6V85_06285 [Clostridiales bacterium]|nr:MAG: hypothetical protein L6V85_06285 [Clostridiales bacterium]